MKQLILLILMISLCASCASRSFELKPGFYEAGHEQGNALQEALEQSSVVLMIGGHATMHLHLRDGSFNGRVLSIDDVRLRLKEVVDKRQATILEEKNYSGQSKLDSLLVSLLQDMQFETIVIQIAHGSGTMIDKVIRN